MTTAERLETARKWKEISVRGLHASLPGGLRGGSYGSVRNYLAGRTEPPLEFLLEAAEILEVSVEWLRGETDHPDPRAETEHAAQDQRDREELEALRRRLEGESEQLERLFASNDVTTVRLRGALARFSRRLDAAAYPGASWSTPEVKSTILRAAAAYLTGLEWAILGAWGLRTDAKPSADRAAAGMALFQMYTVSPETDRWHSPWLDSALDLFARRLRGYGQLLSPPVYLTGSDERPEPGRDYPLTEYFERFMPFALPAMPDIQDPPSASEEGQDGQDDESTGDASPQGS